MAPRYLFFLSTSSLQVLLKCHIFQIGFTQHACPFEANSHFALTWLNIFGPAGCPIRPQIPLLVKLVLLTGKLKVIVLGDCAYLSDTYRAHIFPLSSKIHKYFLTASSTYSPRPHALPLMSKQGLHVLHHQTDEDCMLPLSAIGSSCCFAF